MYSVDQYDTIKRDQVETRYENVTAAYEELTTSRNTTNSSAQYSRAVGEQLSADTSANGQQTTYESLQKKREISSSFNNLMPKALLYESMDPYRRLDKGYELLPTQYEKLSPTGDTSNTTSHAYYTIGEQHAHANG